MILALLLSALAVFKLAPAPSSQPVMYGLLTAFMGFMLVNDPQPAERRRTLALVSLSYFIVPFVVGLLSSNVLLNLIILLGLMFLSFYLRRYGASAAELAMSMLLAYYISDLVGATRSNAFWFGLSGVVGIASAFFVQFVIRPYDPLRYLKRGLAAFNQSGAEVVKNIIQDLTSPATPGTVPDGLSRVHASRIAIDSQLKGLPGWLPDKQSQLRMQLFSIEQELKHLAVSVNQLDRNWQEASPLLGAALHRTLADLRSFFENGTMLEPANRPLVELSRNPADSPGILKSVPDEISMTSTHIAESIRAVQELIADVPETNIPREARSAAAGRPAAGPQGRRLRPTTIFGLQAVLATTLSILVSVLLHLDRPYWTFWTAFIVVAGPAGDSLRKIIFRVVGVALGSLFGTILVTVLPGNPSLLFSAMIFCLMFALFCRVVNYAWTAFWITTFVGLMYGLEGINPNVVLIERPLNTLIGGGIAALVVIFFNPIFVSDRLRGALAQYLAVVDNYLQTLGRRISGTGISQELIKAGLKTSDTFDALVTTFPAIALENNSLANAPSYRMDITTILPKLQADIESLSALVNSHSERFKANHGIILIKNSLAIIHENIESVISTLSRQTMPSSQPNGQRAAKHNASPVLNAGAHEPPPDGDRRALMLLGQINQSILELDEVIQAE